MFGIHSGLCSAFSAYLHDPRRPIDLDFDEDWFHETAGDEFSRRARSERSYGGVAIAVYGPAR
jgi:hypothetical protein